MALDHVGGGDAFGALGWVEVGRRGGWGSDGVDGGGDEFYEGDDEFWGNLWRG